ncbi:MATE family efflux transporter [Salinispira pacifica]|uniref:Multidrug-efflux transporter n=1 Tax=Salinispira pacifica TaxID=1307761 RepID=V5WMC0_9SPIO|nr:MATE family efflux transporter [Salinispira pacifica]AHC16780.1 Na+ driven multidrug efflux pump [Salinispira pacifica]
MKLKPRFTPPFFQILLSLALPIAAQSLLESSVNFLDTFMIGQLGEESLAAVALGNQIYFIVLLMLFGISSGVGIFVSQYWGKKDVPRIRQVMGIALQLSLAGSGLIALFAQLIPEELLKIFTDDQRVIELGVSYLRIASISYPLTSISINFAMGMRSCGEARLPLVATAAGLVINVILNYILIFGQLGFPALGVSGAALGTLIARFFQMLLIIRFAYARKLPMAGSWKEFTARDRLMFRKVMKTAFPVILNEIGWSVGISLFNAVFSRIGTDVFAARNIADTIFRLLLVFSIGVGNACYIMIGNAIGSGRPRRARTLAANYTYLAPVLGGVTGIVLAGLAGIIPGFFNVSRETQIHARNFVYVISLVLPFKSLSLVQIVGILRGGGDTRFSLYLDVGGVWLIGLPLAYASGLLFGWPPMLVFFLGSSEEIVKSVIGLWRTIQGKWLNDLTR